MNQKSKKKREQRVKEEKKISKQIKIKKDKEENLREKLQYQTRPKQTPIVNQDNAILEENVRILQQAIAEHEDLLKKRNESNIEEKLEKFKGELKEEYDSFVRDFQNE